MCKRMSASWYAARIRENWSKERMIENQSKQVQDWIRQLTRIGYYVQRGVRGGCIIKKNPPQFDLFPKHLQGRV
jgi:hypothetical protein